MIYSSKDKLKMKKDTLEYRMMQERQRLKIPDSKLLTGSTKDKFPVILDGGRTTIFISDKSKESEARQKYELRRDNRLMFTSSKPKS
jgi:hypothetical protein